MILLQKVVKEVTIVYNQLYGKKIKSRHKKQEVTFQKDKEATSNQGGGTC
jgi:hypothetical protein